MVIQRLEAPNCVLHVRGLEIPLDLNDTSDFLFYHGGEDKWGYESGLVETATMLVSHNDVCLDVGANRGYLSLVFSQLSGPGGRIHAFEPSPVAIAKFFRTVEANRFSEASRAPIFLHQNAAWDCQETLSLYPSVIESGRDSVQSQGMRAPFQIEAVKVDDILRNERRVRLIKIDVEGSELQALRGMRNVIDNSSDVVLLVEWNRSYATMELWDEIVDRFRVRRLSRHGPIAVHSPSSLHGTHTLLCERIPG